jgi:hypothetical protein
MARIILASILALGVAACSGDTCQKGCLVDSICYPDGIPNPANACQVCRRSASATAWTDHDGATCDDGKFCTVSDTCAKGVCGGSARNCSDAISCNGVETCDEASKSCRPGSSTCADGKLCDMAHDACVATCPGCAIAGACYGAGQVNPANACQACTPATSATSWSNADGATCDDGSFCTVDDVCSAGICAGTAKDCNDGIACNGVETCDEATRKCMPGASTCTANQVCDVAQDACVETCTGCVVAGVCYGAGQANPQNVCQACAPATSATSWTNADGAACDDGKFCTVGDVCSAGTCAGTAKECSDGIACNGGETCDEATKKCKPGTSTCSASQVCDVAQDACVETCTGCVIGGLCYGAGQVNPQDACQACTPATSGTSWTNADGAACDDGKFCTVGDVCSAGTCAGTARDCTDAIACNGVETCDEATRSCKPGTGTCAADEVCDAVSDACVWACAGCVIDKVCYLAGALSTDPCQQCVPSTDRFAWTSVCCPCFTVSDLQSDLAASAATTCYNRSTAQITRVDFCRPGCTLSTCGTWNVQAGSADSYDWSKTPPVLLGTERFCWSADQFDGPPPPQRQWQPITEVEFTFCAGVLQTFAHDQGCPGF